MKQMKAMQDVTYYNNYWNTWGFHGCEADIYETQEIAYKAYVESL